MCRLPPSQKRSEAIRICQSGLPSGRTKGEKSPGCRARRRAATFRGSPRTLQSLSLPPEQHFSDLEASRASGFSHCFCYEVIWQLFQEIKKSEKSPEGPETNQMWRHSPPEKLIGLKGMLPRSGEVVLQGHHGEGGLQLISEH